MVAVLPTGSISLRGPESRPGRRGAALAIVLATTSAAGLAGAVPGPGEARASAPSVAEGCTRDDRAALAAIACTLARELGPLNGAVAVAVAPPVSDRPVTNDGELALRLAQQVSQALGPNTTALGVLPSLAEARRAARRAQTVVHLSLTITRGDVRVTAHAESTALGFWDRVRGKSAGAARRAFAARPVDAEVAAFLPAIPLVGKTIEKARLSLTDVVAIACGDADGDGNPEIALVGRRKIQLGRVRGGAYVPHAEAAWTDLGPLSPAPLREPFAGAAVLPGRGLLVGTSDRRNGAWLTPELKKARALEDGLIPVAGASCVRLRGIALDPAYRPCFAGTGTVKDAEAVANADAVAEGSLVDRDGTARTVRAVRSATSGATGLHDGARSSPGVPSTGGALAVADLNLDGSPELVASTDARRAADDALVVLTWTGEQVDERYRIPVPEGIRALSVCPPEDGSARRIVVATPSHLYLVR